MSTAIGPLQERVRSIMRERYPMMLRGIDEARALAPDIVDIHFEACLQWIVQSHGEGVLAELVEGYATYTLEVNLMQQAYERRGAYEYSTFAEADARVYQNAEYMRNYYWGVLAILFCWSHYVELMEFFLRRFVGKLSAGRLIEVAPGHGLWGLLAIQYTPGLSLEGWDISPTSLALAPRIAAGAGLAQRARYRIGDATQLQHEVGLYDAAICSFMLEHLEAPGEFLCHFATALKQGAHALVSLALTAAQTDHIYEFKHESEGILLAEAAGFELIETRVSRPARLMRGAKYVPRVQAMLLRKK